MIVISWVETCLSVNLISAHYWGRCMMFALDEDLCKLSSDWTDTPTDMDGHLRVNCMLMYYEA